MEIKYDTDKELDLVTFENLLKENIGSYTNFYGSRPTVVKVGKELYKKVISGECPNLRVPDDGGDYEIFDLKLKISHDVRDWGFFLT